MYQDIKLREGGSYFIYVHPNIIDIVDYKQNFIDTYKKKLFYFTRINRKAVS